MATFMGDSDKYLTIDNSYFQEYGLKQFNKTKYHKRENLLIGPNGGGKTRFLRALIKYYKNQGYADTQIVFMDFPHLIYKYKSNKIFNFGKSNITSFIFYNTHMSLEHFMVKLNNETQGFIGELFGLSFNGSIRWTSRKFVKRLNEFLSITLNYTFDAQAKKMKVDGKEYNEAEFLKYLKNWMSPGETNLFYISIFLASLSVHKNNADKLVILLDEPELHLHSLKVTEFIEHIRKALPKAKIWVATHSIHLIPSYKFDQIVHINKGIIQNRKPSINQEIINTVNGTSVKLEIFLQDLLLWEVCDFMQECFLDPESVDKSECPQTKEICERIRKKQGSTEKLRVLDYGAGQGRFGVALESVHGKKGDIEYHVYNEYEDENVKAEFEQKFENAKYYENKWYYQKTDDIPKNYFDFVFLVNTLHEISPQEWKNVFKHIYRALNNDGVLLFGEARCLRKGENPKTGCGYILLDKESILTLTNNEATASTKGPIIHAEIGKKALKPLSQNSSKERIIKALEKLESNSYLAFWEKLNSAGPDTGEEKRYKNGRDIAFYSTQYINARKAIEHLEAYYAAYTEQGEQVSIRILIAKLDEKERIHFGWLCAVRAIPFLFSDGKCDFWYPDDLHRNLLSLFYTLDKIYAAAHNIEVPLPHGTLSFKNTKTGEHFNTRALDIVDKAYTLASISDEKVSVAVAIELSELLTKHYGTRIKLETNKSFEDIVWYYLNQIKGIHNDADIEELYAEDYEDKEWKIFRDLLSVYWG